MILQLHIRIVLKMNSVCGNISHSQYIEVLFQLSIGNANCSGDVNQISGNTGDYPSYLRQNNSSNISSKSKNHSSNMSSKSLKTIPSIFEVISNHRVGNSSRNFGRSRLQISLNILYKTIHYD